MKMMTSSCLSSSLGTYSTSWRQQEAVAHCHLWAPTPIHENDNKQLFVIVFGCILTIMKMMMNNYSLSSLGACFASWRQNEQLVIVIFGCLLCIMKTKWTTSHCHLWVPTSHHEDDDERLLHTCKNYMMTTSNKTDCCHLLVVALEQDSWSP
jgi:hypothetical protein